MAKKASRKKARKNVTKTARKQAKAAARRPVKRMSPIKKKAVKKAKRKPVKAAVTKKARATTPSRRTAAKAPAPKKTAKMAKPAKAAKPARAPKPASAPKHLSTPMPPVPPTLTRERRRLPEAEEETFTNASEDARMMSAARAGHDELRSELKQHTESSPELTAGDVDAKWQDAYALGDEAPGGDNMTPDQGRVDEIGKALGIEYADDEELLGGDELVERDEHRWELDPESKEEEDL